MSCPWYVCNDVVSVVPELEGLWTIPTDVGIPARADSSNALFAPINRRAVILQGACGGLPAEACQVWEAKQWVHRLLHPRLGDWICTVTPCLDLTMTDHIASNVIVSTVTEYQGFGKFCCIDPTTQ